MRFDPALRHWMATPPAPARHVAAAGDRPVLLAGLIGRGIQGSRSPHMHEAEGARLNLPYVYRLIDFDRLALADTDLSAVIALAAETGHAGLNVTHPFKERVIACLDDLAPEARAIGAVNTVTFRDGRSTGHNTDCWGFAESFRRHMGGVPRDRVVLAGAGGAGLAVGRALLDLGVGRIAVHDIDVAKAERLVRNLSSSADDARLVVAGDLEAAMTTADGFVNATPMGMAKYPGLPLPAQALRPDQWVADIVYFPADTALLRAARLRGCRVLPGAGMAIFQAVRAFELITGVMPDADAMAHHFTTADAA